LPPSLAFQFLGNEIPDHDERDDRQYRDHYNGRSLVFGDVFDIELRYNRDYRHRYPKVQRTVPSFAQNRTVCSSIRPQHFLDTGEERPGQHYHQDEGQNASRCNDDKLYPPWDILVLDSIPGDQESLRCEACRHPAEQVCPSLGSFEIRIESDCAPPVADPKGHECAQEDKG